MFKKYIKKLIRQVQNEAIDKVGSIDGYNTDRINELDQKVQAIQQHLGIYIQKNYGYSVQQVPKGLGLASITGVSTPMASSGTNSKRIK